MAKRGSNVEFVKWFNPLIQALKQLGGSAKPKEASTRIADNLKLSDTVLDEKLKSGALKFHNQVQWARQYLAWEGLIDASKRGVWVLSEQGEKTSLTDNDARNIFLKWVEIHQKTRKDKKKDITIEEQEASEPDLFELEHQPSLIEVL